MIGSIGQPLLFLIALGFGFGPTFQKAGGGNYIQFLAPGIIAQAVLFTSISTGIEIIWDRQFGFLKETLVAPVRRSEIMIGRTIGGATIALFQGLLVLIISFMVGFRIENILALPLVLLFIILIALLFTAFGTAIASVLVDMHAFQLIMNFVIMPMVFLSGSLFPLNDLPPLLILVTKMNPLTYGVDGLRGVLIGKYYIGLLPDLIILTTITTILLYLGTYLFSKIEI